MLMSAARVYSAAVVCGAAVTDVWAADTVVGAAVTVVAGGRGVVMVIFLFVYHLIELAFDFWFSFS